MEEGEKYAVTYGHVHFKNALVGSEGKANGVLMEWHDALLQRRSDAELSKSPFGRVMLAFNTLEGNVPQKAAHKALEGSAPIESLRRKKGLSMSLGGGASCEDSEPQAGKKKYQPCSETATAAGGLLVMRQAKMGRIKKFTAELRELLVEVEKSEANCEKTQQLRRLIEDEVAVLGAKFNPAFVEIEKNCFEEAAGNMFSSLSTTSPLHKSDAATLMRFVKCGKFVYDMTLPHRINNSPVIMELQGHSSGVESVAFSPDGTRVVSGSEDKILKLSLIHI